MKRITLLILLAIFFLPSPSKAGNDELLSLFPLPGGGSIRVSYHIDDGGSWLLVLHDADHGWDSAGFYQLPVTAKPDSWSIAACNTSLTAHLYWYNPAQILHVIAPLQEDSGICTTQMQNIQSIYLPLVQ